MTTHATYHRSAPAQATRDQPQRHVTLRQAAANDDQRTIPATIATSDRVAVFDPATFDIIDEILLPEGMSAESRVPLLDGHRDKGTDHVRGSVISIEAENGRVRGTLQFSSDDEGQRAYQLARDRHVGHVSVGYSYGPEDAVDIPPHGSGTVGDQQYTAGNRTLRVTKKWQILEVSLAPIPADQGATIGRSAMTRSTNAQMPAQPTSRQLSEGHKSCMAAALIQRAGAPMPQPESIADEDFIRAYESWTILDFARECLRLEGIRAQPTDSGPELIQRAVTTASFGDVFADAGEKIFTDAIQREPDTSDWTESLEAQSFRPTPVYQLNSAQRLDRRPRGQTATHTNNVSVGGGETIRLQDYTRTFVADDQDLRDDQVGIIRAGMEQLASAAKGTKLDLIYSVLLANDNLSDGTPLFDTSARDNDLGTALDEAALATAMEKIRTTKIEGKPSGLQPRFVIVPPALEHTARSAVRSMELRGEGNLQVRVEPRLQTGIVDPRDDNDLSGSASSTQWYVAAGRRGVSWAHLPNGAQPEVGNWSATGQDGFWGLGFYAKWPLDATAVDYRGLVRGST